MKLTAYNAHEEGRIERLKLIRAMLRYRQIDSAIEELHDSKGELTVTWCAPTREGMKTVEEAWEFCCEYQVKHFFNDVLIAEKE